MVAIGWQFGEICRDRRRFSYFWPLITLQNMLLQKVLWTVYMFFWISSLQIHSSRTILTYSCMIAKVMTIIPCHISNTWIFDNVGCSKTINTICIPLSTKTPQLGILSHNFSNVSSKKTSDLDSGIWNKPVQNIREISHVSMYFFFFAVRLYCLRSTVQTQFSSCSYYLLYNLGLLNITIEKTTLCIQR